MSADPNHLPSPDELEREIGVLGDAITRRDRGEGLDRSYASLDRVEAHLSALFDEVAGAGRDTLVQRVELYVATVLAHNAGGALAMREDVLGRVRPHVIKLPELGKYVFEPAVVVNQFTRTRQQRILRDETEVYDIPLRRRVTDQLVVAEEAELEAFTRDMTQLAGATKGALDRSLASLDIVQTGLAQLVATNEPRDRVRTVQARAVLYVGAVFRTRRKRATWSLCTEPENRSIGQLMIDDWAPMDVLGRTSPDDRPGLLREAVAFESRARR